MKKILLLVPLCVLLIGLTINRVIDEKMKNILAQLQMSEDYAEEMIWSDCSAASFYYPNPKQLKNIAAGERAEIVKTVGKYVKEYVSSEKFLKKYNAYRDMKKPNPPEKPKTMEEQKNEQRENIKHTIATMKETKKTMPAEQHGMFDETIKTLEEQLKEIDNPDNPMFSPEYEAIIMQSYDQEMADYNRKVGEWEKEYPENNPKWMVKKWLAKFLEVSADIDFNAKLAEAERGKKVFVKSEYERKPDVWKLCYRSGKESVNAGREFAQAWLNELK
jgi:hypothetical protein